MKKRRVVLAVTAILLVCVIANPLRTKAEDGVNCPSREQFLEDNFSVVNTLSDGTKVAYTQNGNTITLSEKAANMPEVKVYVNGRLVTTDEHGNITIDLTAEEAASGTSTTTLIVSFSRVVKEGEKPCTNEINYSFNTIKEAPDEPDDDETKEIERELGTLPNESSPIDDLEDESFTKVSDPTKSTSLSCEYGKNDGKTIKKYTHKGVVSDTGDCKTTCREDVVVTLDPPVITQSGMCFSYVADIKTKTVCSAKFTGVKPTKIKGCIAPTNCSSGTHEGGPSSSFDTCIDSCDGGEYTQSCINKCYNQVYGKSTTTKKVSATSKKESSVKYLNSLKEDNAIPTPMANKLKTVKVTPDKEVTCYTDEYFKSTRNMSADELKALAQKVYESKKYLPGGYYGTGTESTWTQSAGHFYYNTSKGTWSWKKNGGCSSAINYYYFSTVDETYNTIKMLNGSIKSTSPTYSALGYYRQYESFDGSLKRARYLKSDGSIAFASECSDTCTITTNCSEKVKNYTDDKKYIVTSAQGNMIYKAELKAYKKAKQACNKTANSCKTINSSYVIKTDETSKNTGNNLGHEYNSSQNINQASSSSNKSTKSGNFPSMIINTNGLCITGECENVNQEYCSSLKPESAEYEAYCKDKQSCKSAGIAACKNGDTCYDYHTTISFPKNYINVKTGQTKVEISKDKLPYYVAVGNAYCTSLTTKDVNINWYNYKLDDTNTVSKPTKINNYNITGKINSYGVFGWNFDFSCFFAIKNPCVQGTKNCPPEEPDNPDTPDNPGNPDNPDTPDNPLTSKVKVRSVNLSNLFPNRAARFNWSANATNKNNVNYKVDPITLRKNIEATGDAVYDSANENKYIDYHIKLTKSAITTIRNYNSGKTYNDTSDGTGLNRLSGQGTWGVTVYRSKLLDQLGTSVITKRGLIGCNNQTSSTTCNTEGGN